MSSFYAPAIYIVKFRTEDIDNSTAIMQQSHHKSFLTLRFFLAVWEVLVPVEPQFASIGGVISDRRSMKNVNEEITQDSRHTHTQLLHIL